MLARQEMKLLYVSQLGEPAAHDLSVFRGLADGGDDAAWFSTRLRELGCEAPSEFCVTRVCLGDELREPQRFEIGRAHV